MKNRPVKVTRTLSVSALTPDECRELIVHSHECSRERRKAYLFKAFEPSLHFEKDEQERIAKWIQQEREEHLLRHENSTNITTLKFQRATTPEHLLDQRLNLCISNDIPVDELKATVLKLVSRIERVAKSGDTAKHIYIAAHRAFEQAGDDRLALCEVLLWVSQIKLGWL